MSHPRPSPLTADDVRRLFDYDAEAGVLRWRVAKAQRNKVGATAGSFNKKSGYFEVTIDRRKYQLHRVIWLHIEGDWPTGQLDHEDTNRKNCRVENLREASQSQNCQNRRRNKNNTTGFKNVFVYKPTGRYLASFRLRGERHHVGYFDTPEAAHAAYSAAILKAEPKFARTA